MSELLVVVGLKAKTDTQDQLRRDLSALVEPSRKEDGNVSYELFEDQNEPGLFIFVEEWASPDARKKHHEQSAHIQNFHASGASNVDSTRFAHELKRVVPPGAAIPISLPLDERISG